MYFQLLTLAIISSPEVRTSTPAFESTVAGLNCLNEISGESADLVFRPSSRPVQSRHLHFSNNVLYVHPASVLLED